MTTFTASEVVAKLRERFASGNDVPVPDVRLTRAEFDVIADRLEADERTEPVMWVDPTTFCDAYPNCVKKLSFMSSDDEDAGVEYVALYTHPAQAQPPAANVTDAMIMRAVKAWTSNGFGSPGQVFSIYRVAKAMLEAALVAQENPNG